MLPVSDSGYTSDLPPPLTQFNATLADKEDFWKLVKAINEANADRKVDDKLLEKSFEACWPQISTKIASINDTAKSEPLAARTKPTSVSTIEKFDSILQELILLSRQQVNMLNSPEQLLPASYLRAVLDREVEGALYAKHPVWSDLRLIWREFEAEWMKLEKDEKHAALETLISRLSAVIDYIYRKLGQKRSLTSNERRRLGLDLAKTERLIDILDEETPK